MSTPQPEAQRIGIEGVSGGKIVGPGVAGTANTVAETVTYHGTVINLHGVSGDFAQVLQAIQRISTDIPAGGDEAPPPPPVAGASMQARIDELLELMRRAEARGETPSQVAAGPVHLSRVELLVKKAVLLVDEANRLSVEALGPRGAELAGGLDPGALGEMLVGLDSPPALDRLRQALTVLREAVRVAPESTSVLLHMAQVFGRVSQKATEEERGILRHVLRLVGTPATEEQRLHHAQATYLLGTVGDERDPALLRQARAEFAALGRAEWLRRCDEALASAETDAAISPIPLDTPAVEAPLPAAEALRPPSSSPPRLHRTTAGRAGMAGAAALVVLLGAQQLGFGGGGGGGPEVGPGVDPGSQPAYTPPAAEQAAFQPAGMWLVQIEDKVGSTLGMELRADGTFTGAQRIAGVDYNMRGRWLWNAASQQLSLDGTVEGVGVARVWYAIEGKEGDAWVAREQSGMRARFNRL